MRADEVMQKDVIAVSPELPLRNFEDLLTSEDISGASVTGSDGRLLGIASKIDIVRVLSQESGYEPYLSELTVEDVMTHKVVLVSPDRCSHGERMISATILTLRGHPRDLRAGTRNPPTESLIRNPQAETLRHARYRVVVPHERQFATPS